MIADRRQDEGPSRPPYSLRLALQAGIALSALAAAAPAQAYTTCPPGGASGTQTCGPNQTINQGVAYLPAGTLILNVLQGTRINAAAGESGVLIDAVTSPVSPQGSLFQVAVAQGAAIAAPRRGVAVDATGLRPVVIDNAGAVTAGAVGLGASSQQGTITVANLAPGQVTAPVGIAAGSTTGPVSVSNAGTITFGQVGIAAGSALGPVAITNGGTIAPGSGAVLQGAPTLAELPPVIATQIPTASTGVFARTGLGALSIVNTGSITGGTGIDAGVLGAQALAQFGVAAPAGVTPGPLLISNAGSITGTSGAAISTVGVSAAQITNAGTVTGFVALQGGGSLTNTGLFDARGTSTFGGGTVVNETGGTILATGGTFGGTGGASTAFTGVGSLVNAGTISLQNGRAGDTFTVNGNYVGRSGQVALDFATQTGTADRLVINGNAGGSTSLFVTNLTPGAAFTTSPAIVQVNGTVAANAFTLGGVQNFGAVEAVLVSGQQGGASTLAVGTVPNVAGLSGQIAVTAARTIAFQSNQAVLDRVEQLRGQEQRTALGQGALPPVTPYAEMYTADARNPIAARIAPAPAVPVGPQARVATWARAFGDLERRDGQGTIVFGGATFNRDMGYDQATGGVLGGADVVISNLTSATDGLILGAFGGYSAASVDLRGAPVRQSFSGESVGAYATYLNGGFFSDVLVKADFLDLGIRGPFLAQNADLTNLGILANVGYKFDLQGGYYIEPTIGVEHVNTDVARPTALTAATVPLLDGYGTRIRGGARVGTEIMMGQIRIEPSVTGLIYGVVDVSNDAAFLGAGAGTASVSLPSDQGKVRGEIQGSVNAFDLSTGLSGFVRADLRFGEDLLGGGGRVGIRYQW